MILDDIVQKKRETLNISKLDLNLMREKANAALKRPSFYEAMKKNGLSIIGEVKKASPSKGVIREDFDYLAIAKEYEKCVDTISVLTEEHFFKGSPKYLEEISKSVNIPLLRKDFIIDEVQIYEGRVLGASTVLLIAAILDAETLKRYIDISRELGMEPLVEVHDEEETTKALNCGSRIIGVNNRDLRDFSIDLNTTIRLSKMIPNDILLISESGISTSEDIKMLAEAGIDGILVGESFMRSGSIEDKVQEFR